MTETEKASIVEMLVPLLDSDGIELVDVEAQGKTLRLLIHKHGGLSVADCQAVNLLVYPILEVHQHLAAYTQLEVASPGIDRPLKTAADFRRHQGRSVRIETVAEDEQTYEVQGAVAEVSDTHLLLTQTAGKRVRVEISRIRSAQVQLVW